MKLSIELSKWRCDRPDEWKMDEFIRNAEKLEAERDALAVYAIDAEKWFNKHDPHGYVSPKRGEAQSVLAAHDAEVAAMAVLEFVQFCRPYGNMMDYPQHWVGAKYKEFQELKAKAGE